MKMKIEANAAQIREIEKIFETITEKLDRTLSRLEDEREGDLWRMQAHTPNAATVDEITREGMSVLSEGFQTLKNLCYAE